MLMQYLKYPHCECPSQFLSTTGEDAASFAIVVSVLSQVCLPQLLILPVDVGRYYDTTPLKMKYGTEP